MYHFVYLHGFLSSPASEKARSTMAYLKRHYPAMRVYVPQLPGNIQEAVKIIDNLMMTIKSGKLRFIGSSMGGFLSTYCVEKYGGKAVLINPAVEPYHLLSDYMGAHLNPYTGERFTIHSGHLQLLREIDTPVIKQAKNYFVLLQTGDETLDYRMALAKYRGAKIQLESGGDHSFQGYENHLTDIFSFLR